MDGSLRNGAVASELAKDIEAFAPRPVVYHFVDPSGQAGSVKVIRYEDLTYATAVAVLAAEDAVSAAAAGPELLQAMYEQTRLLILDPDEATLKRLSRRQMIEISRLSLGLPIRVTEDPTPPD